MNRLLRLAAVLATLAIPAAALAAEAPAAETHAPRVAPTPRVAELLRIVDTEREAIAALRRDIAASRDAKRVLELQRQIEVIKLETEVALLRAQVVHARADGRDDVAARLERMVQVLMAPRASVTATRAAVPAAAR